MEHGNTNPVSKNDLSIFHTHLIYPSHWFTTSLLTIQIILKSDVSYIYVDQTDRHYRSKLNLELYVMLDLNLTLILPTNNQSAWTNYRIICMYRYCHCQLLLSDCCRVSFSDNYPHYKDYTNMKWEIRTFVKIVHNRCTQVSCII